MEKYINDYEKYLIGNVEFFNEVVDILLNKPNVNTELIFKIQRRLKVLKVIESVSKSLEKYFYGKEYEKILNEKSKDHLESFIEPLLEYKENQININMNEVSCVNLNEICSKSNEHTHNYNCSNNVQVNINSNEIFLEDYNEIDELYYVVNKIAEANINFKILDVIKDKFSFEDRINSNKYQDFINTNITLLKIDDYLRFISKEDTDEFILYRMSMIDPNPIWKHYLLEIKIANKELPHTIMSYASYIKENFKDYLYINEDFYKFIGVKALIIMCEIYIKTSNYSKFDECIKELETVESNLLELMYLKAKKVIKTTDFQINNILDEMEREYKQNPNKNSALEGILEDLYKLTGELFERKGDYISAAENYLKSGDLISYTNKLGQAVININNGIYADQKYSSGMAFTSKITTKHKFITDTTNTFNIQDFAGNDHTRNFILELCAKEIKENNVPGEVAELGVFRGEFAKLLNIIFPNKKLYLFDTFESFNSIDMETEVSNNYMDRDMLIEVFNGLKNTSVDIVLNKMKYKDNVVIKKGYFPESIGSLNERFCFVSLDVDLYKPTVEGLKYFYERLSPGGYIFIHDYNHKLCPGVLAAVKDFEKSLGHLICKVPISDFAGSLVITK